MDIPKREYRWRIYHVNKLTSAKSLGTVSAPDEETAIKRAIIELDIKGRQMQKQLVALRQG